MLSFDLLLKKKVILGLIFLFSLLTTWYLFVDRGATIVEQQKKIEELEVNQTFIKVDNVVEVENAVTSNNAKKREEAIREIMKEIEDAENKDANTTYDESIFDGMYLYKTDLL